MLTPGNVQVWIATEPVSLLKSIDGLAAEVERRFAESPSPSQTRSAMLMQWAMSIKSEPHDHPSRLTEVSIDDSSAASVALRALQGPRPVVMIQLPTVQALVAPATALGIRALNETKKRLPQKHYGSAIGSAEKFFSLAEDYSLSKTLMEPSILKGLQGAFIRLKVAPTEFSSPVVAQGTHQGLLLQEGAHRAFFQTLEEAFAAHSEPELFAGKTFSALLCTSANLSGDPLGSITEEYRAFQFAKQTGISLWVRSQLKSEKKGSYPILFFENHTVSVERTGPEFERILESLPPSIVLRQSLEARV